MIDFLFVQFFSPVGSSCQLQFTVAIGDALTVIKGYWYKRRVIWRHCCAK